MIEELKLRELLWLRHGCGFGALYGDDGEMQCSSCGIDFKRMSPEVIEEKLKQGDLRRRIEYEESQPLPARKY